MKKRILALLLSATMVMGLAACGGSGSDSGSSGGAADSGADTGSKAEEETAQDSSSEQGEANAPAASGDKVNLNFYIWSDEENYIRKVVDAYNEEQDGVQVTLNVVPESDYDDKLKVMLAGETDADLVDIRGVAQMSNYAMVGALLDITDRLEGSDIDTAAYGEMWNTSDYEGKFYALPTRTTCWELFYNADIISEAGMEAPGQMTWEEYVDYSSQLAQALSGKTAADGSPLKAGFWVNWIYHFYSVQHEVYANDENTEYIQASLELLNELMSNGSHYTFSEVSSGTYDYMTEFQNGHVALLPNGEWCVNMLMEAGAKGETDVNWEVAPMPVPEGVADGTSWGQFQYAAITSTCAHPDEAFDFLSYLCGSEGSSIYSSTGMIHAYSSEEAKKSLAEASGKESTHFLFEANKIQEQPNVGNYGEFTTALSENAQLYLLGEIDIDECMKNFKAQGDEIRSKQ